MGTIDLPALATQVGGDHYKRMPIQPVEFALVNELNTCQANVLKYVCRYQNKEGRRDLQKADHYCDLWLEIQPAYDIGWGCAGIEWRPEACAAHIPLSVFVRANMLPDQVASILDLICHTPTPERVREAQKQIRALRSECSISQ